MGNDVWIYLETDDGTVQNVSWEMLGKGRELADELETGVTAVLAGTEQHLEGLGEAAVARGADRVIEIRDPLLEVYRPETFAKAVGRAVEDGEPGFLLLGATHNGIDLAGRLAVRLRVGLTADVTEIYIDEEGDMVGAVPAFGGDIVANIKAVDNEPKMTTVRPGVFEALEPDDAREGEIEVVDPGLEEDDVVTDVLTREVGESIDLPSADVVVAAGRGFGGDLELANELADALDATVGVTRPLCDEGLVSRDRQIGSTGFSLKADVAIVAGISGSVYFTSGIEDVDTVIAVNTDPDEPIFEHADYCVEGDVFEVLPALIDALRATEVVA